MYSYPVMKWILYFFSYCFIGWIWECSYVYLRTHHWENRGFLHGPVLPIYGFGALIILWITIPAKGHPGLIFLLGMIGATILEYISGMLLLQLFHIRYWDYSHVPFNLNGHICLLCSLVWGIFSILLVKWLHGRVEHTIAFLPQPTAYVLGILFLSLFIFDIFKSIQSVIKN